MVDECWYLGPIACVVDARHGQWESTNIEKSHNYSQKNVIYSFFFFYRIFLLYIYNFPPQTYFPQSLSSILSFNFVISPKYLYCVVCVSQINKSDQIPFPFCSQLIELSILSDLDHLPPLCLPDGRSSMPPLLLLKVSGCVCKKGTKLKGKCTFSWSKKIWTMNNIFSAVYLFPHGAQLSH